MFLIRQPKSGQLGLFLQQNILVLVMFRGKTISSNWRSRFWFNWTNLEIWSGDQCLDKVKHNSSFVFVLRGLHCFAQWKCAYNGMCMVWWLLLQYCRVQCHRQFLVNCDQRSNTPLQLKPSTLGQTCLHYAWQLW